MKKPPQGAVFSSGMAKQPPHQPAITSWVRVPERQPGPAQRQEQQERQPVPQQAQRPMQERQPGPERAREPGPERAQVQARVRPQVPVQEAAAPASSGRRTRRRLPRGKPTRANSSF